LDSPGSLSDDASNRLKNNKQFLLGLLKREYFISEEIEFRHNPNAALVDDVEYFNVVGKIKDLVDTREMRTWKWMFLKLSTSLLNDAAFLLDAYKSFYRVVEFFPEEELQEQPTGTNDDRLLRCRPLIYVFKHKEFLSKLLCADLRMLDLEMDPNSWNIIVESKKKMSDFVFMYISKELINKTLLPALQQHLA